jgi:asparagine synthase (glutamine-hydrolysing)
MCRPPKTGFGLPIGDWLRGPLRDWAESLLDVSSLTAHGFLDAAPIRAAWSAHLRGTRNLDRELWTVLMFQAWHRHVFEQPSHAVHVA